jgi:hypothetical protein
MEGSGENAQSLSQRILQLMVFFEQLRHVIDRDPYHNIQHRRMDWYLLTGEEEASARRAEQDVREKIKSSHADPPHDEIVWSCARCRDLPVEEDVQSIEDVMIHITEEYEPFSALLCVRALTVLP